MYCRLGLQCILSANHTTDTIQTELKKKRVYVKQAHIAKCKPL